MADKTSIMAEMTNLTDRLTHLRDRKQSSPIIQGDPNREQKPKKDDRAEVSSIRERRFATDYFMFFVYTLLGVAVVTQLILIVWLDVV
jgi:hypothetical protein